ncbi:hypothetical protein TCAL_02394 [Tigriopus californicus]|uniref:C2H2-type domain-containing protein n=1 Tax=Tigriopus californicus TaxID=6832 RepID=A0A553P0A3_TIGCA|nr:zinc finger protein 26-like [Tigriopus californicus]TRY71115.1 hypothetical protein TCAL_02394 [Tigriopus californicus]
MEGHLLGSIKLEPEDNGSFEIDLKSTVVLPIEAQEWPDQDQDPSQFFRCFKCEHPFHTDLGRRNHESVCKAGGSESDLVCSKFDKSHEETLNYRATVMIFEKSLFQDKCRDMDEDMPPELNDVPKTKKSKSFQMDLSCLVCRLLFPNLERFAQHEVAHTYLTKVERTCPHICGDCGQDFPTLEAVDLHIKSGSNSCSNRPKVIYPCRICDRMFQRRDKLRDHIMDHLGGVLSDPKYKCKYCQKSFEGVSLFAIHLRSHRGRDSIVCKTCRKTFHSESALRKHERIHSGEKPFWCGKCPARFFARETLNRHQKVHAKNAIEDPLCGSMNSCQSCNRDFLRKGDLEKHLNLVHNHHFDQSFDPKKLALSHCLKPVAKTYARKRVVKIESCISIKSEPLFDDQSLISLDTS